MAEPIDEGPHADIVDVVRGMAPVRPERLRADDRLTEDLGFDSVRLIELAVALEVHLGLPKVDLERAVTVSTVGDVIALVGLVRTEVP